MKLFEIHTEENEKDIYIDFGVHGVYADNKKDALKYAETEIVTDFLSMGYKVKIERTSKHSIVYVWDDEDIKYRRIVIWAIQKEKKNTISKTKNKEQKMAVETTIELMENEKRYIIKADTCDRDCAKCELLKKTEDLLSAYDMVIKALEQPDIKLTNSEWIDFLVEQFDISRTSAKEMLHAMMSVKREDNFKKQFSGRK